VDRGPDPLEPNPLSCRPLPPRKPPRPRSRGMMRLSGTVGRIPCASPRRWLRPMTGSTPAHGSTQNAATKCRSAAMSQTYQLPVGGARSGIGSRAGFVGGSGKDGFGDLCVVGVCASSSSACPAGCSGLPTGTLHGLTRTLLSIKPQVGFKEEARSKRVISPGNPTRLVAPGQGSDIFLNYVTGVAGQSLSRRLLDDSMTAWRGERMRP